MSIHIKPLVINNIVSTCLKEVYKLFIIVQSYVKFTYSNK